MLKLIGIDFDGTIADTLPLCIEAFRQSLKPIYNRLLSDAEITESFGLDEEGIARLLGGEHWQKVLKDYIYFYEELHSNYTSTILGIDELFKRIKSANIPLALITGKAERSAVISLKKLGIYDKFDAFEFGDPFKNRKADAIANLLKKFNVSQSEFVYIGDAPSDVEACNKNGVRCISAAYAQTAEVETLEKINSGNVCYSVKDVISALNL